MALVRLRLIEVLRLPVITVIFKLSLLLSNELYESVKEGLVPVGACVKADSNSVLNEFQEILMIHDSLFRDHVVHRGKGERVDLLHDCVRLLLPASAFTLRAKLIVIRVLRITVMDFVLLNSKSFHELKKMIIFK